MSVLPTWQSSDAITRCQTSLLHIAPDMHGGTLHTEHE